MEDKKPRKNAERSIASLRLNVEEAEAGRTWLLLPEGFRHYEAGSTYPLPARRRDLQRLATVYIPPSKKDSGCIYLRRALAEWKRQQGRRISALHDIDRRQNQILVAHRHYRDVLKDLRAEARHAIDEVKQEAEQAVASLRDLFALGRRGIDGQMRAHLDGAQWHGEQIDARAFRECFRMVSQAVKGLGLPSDQREKATEAVMEEVAAALKDTQETVALAPIVDPDPDSETEH